MACDLVDGQWSSNQRWRGLNEPTGHHNCYVNDSWWSNASLEAADWVRGGAGTDGWTSSSKCSVLCCISAAAAAANEIIVFKVLGNGFVAACRAPVWPSGEAGQ
jgi:hypothetical protein